MNRIRRQFVTKKYHCRHSAEILKPEETLGIGASEDVLRHQSERAQKSLQLPLQKPTQASLEETPTRQTYHRKKQPVQLEEPQTLSLLTKQVRKLRTEKTFVSNHSSGEIFFAAKWKRDRKFSKTKQLEDFEKFIIAFQTSRLTSATSHVGFQLDAIYLNRSDRVIYEYLL